MPCFECQCPNPLKKKKERERALFPRSNILILRKWYHLKMALQYPVLWAHESVCCSCLQCGTCFCRVFRCMLAVINQGAQSCSHN